MPKSAIIALIVTASSVSVLAGAPPSDAHTQAPTLTISPLSGTPDAPPQSQISLLGAPISQLHEVLVRGSRSGVHSGKLEAYSTGNGASFIPTHPFQVGELVSVSVKVGSGNSASKVSSSFTVGNVYTLPTEHLSPSKAS
ncbi:MAG: hypothetical protein ACRDK2_02930, partial [Solirubrobacteraceae bacterium]